MEEKKVWDWHTPLKEIPVKEWESRFNWVEEPCISNDGESIASIVNIDEMAFGICVDGQLWDGEHEKAWSLQPVSHSGFAACVCQDEEWTLTVNGQEWSNRFDFLWDMQAAPLGEQIGMACQRDGEYGMVVNDQPWEQGFDSISGMVMGSQGQSAAIVQVESMAAADVDAFAKGLFSVAVNGQAREERFLNIWDLAFDTAGDNLTWAIRLNREQYSIAVNGVPWDGRFQSVWRPMFLEPNQNQGQDQNQDQGRSKSVVAPVKYMSKWRLFKDNQLFWTSVYENIWRLIQSQDKLAAVVAPAFGQWTVAEDDQIWPVTWDTMVRDIYYSRDGSSLVAVFKDKGSWGLAKNAKSWTLACDNIFTPVMSHDGSVVAVGFEKSGRYFVSVNDKVITGPYSAMADPVISPDGEKILIKGIEDGVYKRRIIEI